MNKIIMFTGMLVFSAMTYAVDWAKEASGLMGNSDTETAVPAAIDYAKGLLPAVTESLGVTERQASGGLGSLFTLAKGSLNTEDFSSLSKLVPGMDSLLSAAPEVAGEKPSLGGVLANTGGYGKALSGANNVYQQFSALGLSAANVTEYISIASGYLKSEGGQAAVDIFKKSMGSLLSD